MAAVSRQESSSTSESVPTLQRSMQELARRLQDPNSDLPEQELPGLYELIDDWYSENSSVTQEDFARRILEVFKNSTHNEVYARALQQLPEIVQSVIGDFVAQKKTAEEASKFLAHRTPMAAAFMGIPASEPSDIVPGDKGQHDLKASKDLTFQNWGRTVKNTPAITYYPETVKDVQTIVREAVEGGKGVRVSGFRHSWSPVFGRNDIPGQGNNGDVLISTLPENIASTLPCLLALPGDTLQPKKTELNEIKVVDAEEIGGPRFIDGKKYVSVGMATTNEQFRRWCIKEGHVTLPLNVIMVEITYGGSNAPICHGAGIKHPSLSDLVRGIEYVDAHGELRTIKMGDPALKAASGCFGLLGVVTRITFECDAMRTAVMRPAKLHVIEAIPPPPEMKDSDIPAELRKPRTPEQKKDDLEKFKSRANNEYYAEWFWFPFSDEVWVNTWSTETDRAGAEDYPSIGKVFLQVVETVCMNLLQEILSCIKALQLAPELQTKILSWFAMMNLDERKENQKPIRALVPDALHFQRGIQNLRVRDLEVAFPVSLLPLSVAPEKIN
ncbi:hypothetical protein O1611_g5625 [Lasiodiplodia mahajangana]|uniref:Uncharacterized protein n=1 Tax=Lasiodiplodia mahajangana TaxID=1108764 RepID=A0ACC2JKP7_9PEZI|nr:hypothetical protein O1611_g5625 [Lasiodiplodia mahajangana]